MPLVSETDADSGVPPSPRPGRCPLFAALLLIAAGSACAGDAVVEQPATASSGPRSFALYALSRGQGVPEGARTAMAGAERLLEDLQDRGEVTLTKERIGLEGETRLCASFADASLAERTLERLRRLVAGVDLVNLTEEPCAPEAGP